MSSAYYVSCSCWYQRYSWHSFAIYREAITDLTVNETWTWWLLNHLNFQSLSCIVLWNVDHVLQLIDPNRNQSHLMTSQNFLHFLMLWNHGPLLSSHVLLCPLVNSLFLRAPGFIILIFLWHSSLPDEKFAGCVWEWCCDATEIHSWSSEVLSKGPRCSGIKSSSSYHLNCSPVLRALLISHCLLSLCRKKWVPPLTHYRPIWSYMKSRSVSVILK